MPYNIIFKILLILLILGTFGIAGSKPKMHKKFLIYDSEYKIVENVKLPTVTEKNLPQQTQKVVKEYKEKPIEQTEQKQNVVQSQEEKTVLTKKQPEVVQKSVRKSSESKVQKEQREQIAWNKWRSNLQNQIMNDTDLPIVPEGTVFKFSFNVDKYGRITNVQTWSMTDMYTPYAIQYIAPVIRSYQGKSILDFPGGSTRERTEVIGGWKITAVSRYSSPLDYKDVETVKNQR